MATSQKHNTQGHAGTSSPVGRDVPLSASISDRPSPRPRGGRVQQAAPEDASAGVIPPTGAATPANNRNARAAAATSARA